MENVIITDENFIWLDITSKVGCGVKAIQDIWLNHSIYALHEDGTQTLLEYNEEIDEAISLGLKIGMDKFDRKMENLKSDDAITGTGTSEYKGKKPRYWEVRVTSSGKTSSPIG